MGTLLGVALADWLVFPFLIWLIQINQATVDNFSAPFQPHRWRCKMHSLHGKCIGIGVQTHTYSYIYFCIVVVGRPDALPTLLFVQLMQLLVLSLFLLVVGVVSLFLFVTLLIYIFITFYSCSCCIMPSAVVAAVAATNCIKFWCVLINFELISYFIIWPALTASNWKGILI